MSRCFRTFTSCLTQKSHGVLIGRRCYLWGLHSVPGRDLLDWNRWASPAWVQLESIPWHDWTHWQICLHCCGKLELRCCAVRGFGLIGPGFRLVLRLKVPSKYIACTDSNISYQYILHWFDLFSGGVTAGACKLCQAGTYSISSGRVCPDVIWRLFWFSSLIGKSVIFRAVKNLLAEFPAQFDSFAQQPAANLIFNNVRKWFF